MRVGIVGVAMIGLVMGVAVAQEALGPVYPIPEPDLLSILKRHAREEAGELKVRTQQAQKALQRYAERPTAGPNMPTALVDREWAYAAPKIEGASVALLPDDFERQWLFIDGDSHKQVMLAARFMKGKSVATHRVILVNGSVKDVSDTLKTRVWFDQARVLTKRFEVKAVPALLKATKERIWVKEIAQ